MQVNNVPDEQFFFKQFFKQVGLRGLLLCPEHFVENLLYFPTHIGLLFDCNSGYLSKYMDCYCVMNILWRTFYTSQLILAYCLIVIAGLEAK